MRWVLIAAAVVLVAAGCGRRAPGRRAPKRNQISPLASPSGKYVLTVPIEKDSKQRNDPVWRVTVSDCNGTELYKDTQSGLLGYFNVYWVWDSEDRVWLYNSDDGVVYCWRLADGKWEKIRWGGGTRKETDLALAPPPELYPDYARKDKPTQ